MESTSVAKKLLGRRLREQRHRMRISQQDVAEHAGVALSFYSQMERGQANPSLETICRVATTLHTSFTELLCAEELERFEAIAQLLKGVPASMRVLTLKAFADVAGLVKDTEKTVRARYE